MPKNSYLIIAGTLNFLVFLLHLIGGQIDLVNPMMDASLSLDKSTQLLGAWHMVTIILFATSFILLSAGLGKKYASNLAIVEFANYLNLFFSLPSIIASIYYGLLVPQWILFLPICIITSIGLSRQRSALELVG